MPKAAGRGAAANRQLSEVQRAAAPNAFGEADRTQRAVSPDNRDGLRLGVGNFECLQEIASAVCAPA